ncbi:HEPN domain-containing protein [Pedobacter sp. GR22-6]|uniref:HEPN domain-containing protein n=1 Tax=Pedobacter sp. GR22-6 TaxID=3127957 RepID=UPI00307F18CD
MSTKISTPNDPNLAPFITKLADKYQALHIYSFGFVSARQEMQTLFRQHIESSNQHFLLMVTAHNTRIDHEVQDYSNANYKEGKINILVFGIENIGTALERNSRFIISIIQEGLLMYNKEGAIVPMPLKAYDHSGAKQNAMKLIEKRIKLIQGFLKSARQAVAAHDELIGVFMLHQCVEQSAVLLLRVFADFRSEIHNLSRLLDFCALFSLPISRFFNRNDAEDERLFQILRKSYSSTRYQDDCEIALVDAAKLLYRVSAFVKMVDLLCTEKLEAMS